MAEIPSPRCSVVPMAGVTADPATKARAKGWRLLAARFLAACNTSAGRWIPEGAEGFAGKINEEIEIVLDVEGLYGVKCKPHFNMGMVMTIAVGDVAQTPDTYFEGRIPKKALARFDTQLANLN